MNACEHVSSIGADCNVKTVSRIIIIIIIVEFVKRHTRSYRGASGGVNQVA